MKKKRIMKITSIAIMASLVIGGALFIAIPFLKSATTSRVPSQSEPSLVTTYSVTWQNYDGTILEVNNEVPHGVLPEYTGATPVKARSAQYTFTFNKWSPEVVPAVKDATYVAEFSDTVNNYEITWNNYDGSLLKTEWLPYGTIPEYKEEAPIRAKTAAHTYTFSNWSPQIVEVTENTTYTAEFSQTVNNYKVTWKNYDGTLLKVDEEVPYGTVPEYIGPLPTKDPAIHSSFEFSGWSPVVVAVSEDTTYTALFTTIYNTYEIVLDLSGGTFIDPNTAPSVLVTYNEAYSLPVINSPTNTPFGGWFYNGTQITNEFGVALVPYLFTEDINVVAEFFIPIYTREDLVNISDNLTADYRLMNDLDLSSEPWIPINDFGGNFDGQDYTIIGIVVEDYYENLGLFGTVNEATIHDLTLVDTVIDVVVVDHVDQIYAGALVGSVYDHNLTLRNIKTIDSNISATFLGYGELVVGGLLGQFDSKISKTLTISDSYNDSHLLNTSWAGGLVGRIFQDNNSEVIIENSANSGDIAPETYAAGLIAYYYGMKSSITITGSHNSGNVTGFAQIAGFIGHTTITGEGSVTIRKSYNSGNITTDSNFVGGFLAHITSWHEAQIVIEESYNSGNITGYDRIGGLIGTSGVGGNTLVPKIMINNTYNTGMITSTHDFAGGLVGYSKNIFTIRNSYNSGQVSAANVRVGGLIGHSENSGLIKNSVNFATVQGISHVGHIIGQNKNNGVTISNTYFTGEVLDQNDLNFGAPTPGGTLIEKALITQMFITDTLEWDESIWDLINIDTSNNTYPKFN